jgi:hypothetical protein
MQGLRVNSSKRFVFGMSYFSKVYHIPCHRRIIYFLRGLIGRSKVFRHTFGFSGAKPPKEQKWVVKLFSTNYLYE